MLLPTPGYADISLMSHHHLATKRRIEAGPEAVTKRLRLEQEEVKPDPAQLVPSLGGPLRLGGPPSVGVPLSPPNERHGKYRPSPAISPPVKVKQETGSETSQEVSYIFPVLLLLTTTSP